jgi:hypothetical protein
MDSPPDVRPSAKVLAESFRRKLASQKVCEVLFDDHLRLINRKFFAGFVKINYRNFFAIATLERKYALKKQNPVLQKYLSRCLDSKYLILLKNLPFWKVLIRKMFYQHR